MTKKHTNESIDQMLVSRDIKRLDNYINYITQIKWQCLKENCNYIWLAMPSGIISKLQSGCPKCAGVPKISINDMHILAAKHNGKCLSKIYINAHTKYEWECDLGHNFLLSGSHITQGHWCPKCGHKYVASLKRNTIENMQKIAIERNGKCLSSIYIDAHNKLEWQCELGHIWEAIPNSILRGTWCPKCLYKNQTLTAEVLDEMSINYIQPYTIYIDNQKYHPDFYLENHSIIIEYNGEQHYKPVRFGGQTLEQAKLAFEKQKIRDEKIRQYCKSNQIRLLEIDGRIIQGKNLIRQFLDEKLAEIAIKK